MVAQAPQRSQGHFSLDSIRSGMGVWPCRAKEAEQGGGASSPSEPRNTEGGARALRLARSARPTGDGRARCEPDARLRAAGRPRRSAAYRPLRIGRCSAMLSIPPWMIFQLAEIQHNGFSRAAAARVASSLRKHPRRGVFRKTKTAGAKRDAERFRFRIETPTSCVSALAKAPPLVQNEKKFVIQSTRLQGVVDKPRFLKRNRGLLSVPACGKTHLT